jgi:threonine synthase
MGLQDLLGKLEFCNPTGSFKDRGNAVQVSVLKETSITQVADVAVNNAGESCAAYCARAGIRFIGIIGEDSPQLKAWATAFYGTEIQSVKGDRQARFVAAKKFCDANNILFMNYGKNAYFIEGQKTIAYEIVEQMDPVPEHIIMPVGNGSILLGLWLGFREMIEDGRVSRIPRLYGVQAEDVQPLVASFYRQEWVPPPGGSTSIAIGIGITNPPRLEALVQACRRSGGIPVAVADEDIMAWQKRLAQLEGLFVEPTSATVVAAIDKLKRANLIEGSERVLLILTAAGIKEPLTIAGNVWLSKDY